MLAKPNPAGLKHQMDPHGCVAGKMPFAGIPQKHTSPLLGLVFFFLKRPHTILCPY